MHEYQGLKAIMEFLEKDVEKTDLYNPKVNFSEWAFQTNLTKNQIIKELLGYIYINSSEMTYRNDFVSKYFNECISQSRKELMLVCAKKIERFLGAV